MQVNNKDVIYWVEDIKDGSCKAGANSYEEALRIQHKFFVEEGIDTYIRKHE